MSKNFKKEYYRAMDALRKSQSEAIAKQQTIDRMKSQLVSINERECTIDAWNAIYDALGEIDA